MSDHITPDARKLLQRLTATGASIDYNRQTETWYIGSDRLTGARERAAKEILHLCCIQTAGGLPPVKRFTISQEGTRCLMRPGYVPVIIAARNRKT